MAALRALADSGTTGFRALRQFDEGVRKLRSEMKIEGEEEDELRGLRERILRGSWWARLWAGGGK
jgi:hypothetical protein